MASHSNLTGKRSVQFPPSPAPVWLFLRCFYFLPPEQIESVREFIVSMDGFPQKRCRGEIMMKVKLKGDQVKVPSETLLDFTPRQNVSIQTSQN